MKITVFNGSPRGEKGNTHFIVSEFCKGAKDAGAEIEHVFLADKDIKHCLGCFVCWIRTPGICVHDDDMKDLLEKFASSDLVIFATPVYIDNVTGLMKNFMDRMIPISNPHFDKDETGECKHTFRQKLPRKFIVVSNCGFPEQTHFQVIRLLARRMMRNFDGEIVGEIYRGGGEMFREAFMRESPFVQPYRELLHKAGQEVVEQGRISEETTAALEQPLVPDAMYINASNKYWNAELAKIEKKSL